LKVLEILNEYNQEDTVFITVAGRSNALSGFVDANTPSPVIACPPKGSSFEEVDIFSSLRMPSGVGPMVVLDPENAALAAVKILSLSNSSLRSKVSEYQQKKKDEIESCDKEVMQNG
jgi:5-(carboxyamino)imidazole ribonucleotide mutase